MATLVQDNFDRASSATVIGTPQIGPAPIVRSGVGGITANTLYGPTAALLATWECGVTDVEIEVTASAIQGSASRGIGMVFGFVSVNDYWRLYWDSATYIALSWWHGVWTTVVQLDRVPTNGDVLKGSYKSGVFRCYTNGVEEFSYKVEGLPYTGTAHGIYFPHTQPRADNLLISDAPDLPPDTVGVGASVAPASYASGASPFFAQAFPYRGRDTKALDTAGGA